MSRQPLHPLPLDRFIRSSTSSSSSRSPSKPLGDMSLLPSPFLSTRTTPGPLSTLYEAPRSTASPRAASRGLRADDASRASPRTRMEREDDDQRLGDDEMPFSSPRRLLDLFRSAGASPDKRTLGAGGSPRAVRGSMPPPSPRRVLSPFPGKREDKEEEAPPPTWSFYQDDGEEDSPSLPSADAEEEEGAAEDAPMSSPPSSSSEEPDLDHKENARPPPRRRRSTSLLSQASTVAGPPTASTSAVPSSNPSPRRPPPPALPLPEASHSAPPSLIHPLPRPHSTPRTPPPASTPSPTFPSSAFPDFFPSAFSSGVAGGLGAPFAEPGVTSFSPALATADADGVGGGGLLAAFGEGERREGGRKRSSVEGAGGVKEKRPRLSGAGED